MSTLFKKDILKVFVCSLSNKHALAHRGVCVYMCVRVCVHVGITGNDILSPSLYLPLTQSKQNIFLIQVTLCSL